MRPGTRAAGGPRCSSGTRCWTSCSSAVAAAATGRGGAALLTGEAGIGKTSVVRALRASLDHGVRVLAGACDDLLSPRALGPLREAAAGTTGPLAAALAGTTASPTRCPARPSPSSPRGGPTVLIVEDLHWADDATLDVLGHVARRLADLPALLVLTYRDEEVPPAHPAAPGPRRAHRGARAPARAATAVAGRRRRAGRGQRPRLRRAARPDRRQPVLRHRGPRRARRHRAGHRRRRGARPGRPARPGRAATRSSSCPWCPRPSSSGWPGSCSAPRFDALAPAEEQGVLQVRDDGLAFRHELARRAVEQSLSALRRRALHRRVIAGARRGGAPGPAAAGPPRRPRRRRRGDPGLRARPPGGRRPRPARTARRWPTWRRRCGTPTGCPTASAPACTTTTRGSCTTRTATRRPSPSPSGRSRCSPRSRSRSRSAPPWCGCRATAT